MIMLFTMIAIIVPALTDPARSPGVIANGLAATRLFVIVALLIVAAGVVATALQRRSP